MRTKRLRISVEFLKRLFGEGIKSPYEVMSEPVPSDARIIDCRFDGYSEGGIAEFLIESQSFQELQPGARIPELAPVLTELPTESPASVDAIHLSVKG